MNIKKNKEAKEKITNIENYIKRNINSSKDDEEDISDNDNDLNIKG